MDIATLAGLVPTLYELSKEAVGLASKTKDTKILEAVSKWQKEQIEFLSRFAEFQAYCFRLQDDIRTLKDWQSVKNSLKFRENMYWREGDESPFCSACVDGKDRLIRLHSWRNECGYLCPECKTSYQTKDLPSSPYTPRKRNWTTDY